MKLGGFLKGFIAACVSAAAYWVVALAMFWLIGNCETPSPDQCEARGNTGAIFLLMAFVLFGVLAAVAGVKALSKKA